MTPFPTKITQSEKQFVLFSANHYYYTPYTVKKQSATVSLATSSVESHSKLKPTSQSDNAITYGPYSDVEAFQISPMRVHFENNTPFLSVCTVWLVKCSANVRVKSLNQIFKANFHPEALKSSQINIFLVINNWQFCDKLYKSVFRWYWHGLCGFYHFFFLVSIEPSKAFVGWISWLLDIQEWSFC